MAEYIVGDIRLDIADALIDEPLGEALSSGRFEALEARAVAMHIGPEDRVLELGAGCGFLTALIARRVGASNVVAVEPNPDMAAVVSRTMELNGLAPVTLVQAVAVAEADTGTVPFFVRRGFWSASLDQRRVQSERKLNVPARSMEDLLQTYKPTVLVADLEGAEAELFRAPLHQGLRLIILELHRKHYGSDGVKRVFDGLSASGFAYCPRGSRGGVVVFERVGR